jgi:phenylpyruvate tautomerase PptA (4-oxalocrotonate tautomerase family)
MNKFSRELIESLTEAVEHAEGKPSAVRVHVVEVSDVQASAEGCGCRSTNSPAPAASRSRP